MDYRYYIDTINSINSSLYEIIRIYRNQQYILNNLYYSQNPITIPVYPYPIPNPLQEPIEPMREEYNQYQNNNQYQDPEESREESFEQHMERLINENVRKMRFGDIENPLNMICPITREEFNADDEVGIINHCNHIFNYDVLVSWLSRNFVCPLCRYDIRGESHQGENGHPQILCFREIVE